MSITKMRWGAVVGLAISLSSAFAQVGERIAPDLKPQIAVATTVNTRDFRPQVATPSPFRYVRPENPEVLPWTLNGPPNGLKAGTTFSEGRTGLKAKFPGQSYVRSYPPDLDLAVGSRYIVSTANSVIAFFDKTDGSRVFQQDLFNFFAGTGIQVNFLFDPKCFYDPLSGRYFLVTLEQDDATKDSAYLLAVSATSDPNGTWFRYRINAVTTVNGVDCWMDYPGFGFNNDAVVITGNLFGFNNGPFKGAKINVVPKAPLLTGGSTTITSFTDSNSFTLSPCRTWDVSANVVRSVAYQNSTTLKIHAIQNGGSTSPTVSSITLAVPSAMAPAGQITGPGTSTVDALDGRILNAMEYGGTIVAGHTIQTSVTDTRTQCRWYEIDAQGWPTSSSTPILKQSGTVSGGTGESYHMPAIAKSQDGSIGLIYSRTSRTIMADLLTSGRLASDPLGQMSAGAVVATSAGLINNNEGGRWGDFYGLTLDPTDRQTFWGVGELVSASNHWTSTINSFKIANPVSTLDASAASTLVGNSVSGDASALATVDSNYYSSQSILYSGLGQIVTQRFSFKPTAALANLKSLAINLNFTTSSKATTQLYVLNVSTGNYELLGSANGGIGVTVSKSLSTNLSNYLDGNGNVLFALKATLKLRDSASKFLLQTDQAQVVQTTQ